MTQARTWRWLLAGVLAIAATVAQADDALWALLREGGQVVVIRHALTDPGVGDPPGFQLGECRTQRNLSEEGRGEARRLGDALRARRVPVAGVQSSPWCRSMETAQLAFRRAAQAQPALGNLFGRPEREAQQVADLRRLVQAPAGGGNLFLVTHGSTTLALTGVSPATAEMVVLTPQAGGGFKVAGRLRVP
ncbi:histidine phosphatase family protein [Ramlibacter sp. PS3R-8]|uniref:histidine phosphatase family protein n=1 Tax=Ramlibacter sp. PS3R-8 TaxID=3133437 RepID=UPI0030B126A8